MKRRAVAAVVLLAASLGGNASAACPPEKFAAFDLGFTSSGTPYVPISIQSHAINMRLDTGGIESSLTAAVASSLNLQRGTISNYRLTIGGDAIDNYAVAHDVDLGGRHIIQKNFMIIPDCHLSEMLGGVLGPDVLRQHDVEFDFAAGKMTLFSSRACAGSMVYWTKEQNFAVPISLWRVGPVTTRVTVDGAELTAVVDTGSGQTSMPLETAEKLFHLDANSPDLKPVPGYSGGYYRYPLKLLSFENGPGVGNPDIILVKHSETGFNEDMVLGLNVLRQFHLYFAYGQQRLFMSAASAH